MEKKIILLFMVSLPLILKAQLLITAQLPPGGFVQKEQLWNLILVNNKEDILELNIQMNLQDASTGAVVFSANSSNIILGKGMKVISAKDAQPIVYNYTVPDFSRNYLPMGAYVICYQVNSNISKGPLAQDCIHLNIDPLSPPLLNTPTDKSEVQSPYPQFTWMPPTPYDMFTSLSYDLIVTEVLPGQSAIEAIQFNTAVYFKTDLTQPYESYASSFTKLDTGKIYAWQVVAKNGLNYAAKTDVWTFKIAPPSFITMIIDQTPFIKMKKDNPEKGIAPNGVLKLSYVNETTDSVITVNIIDLNNQQKNVPGFVIKIKPGENLIQYSLKKLVSAGAGQMYEARIINSRKEKWAMRFEVREYK